MFDWSCSFCVFVYFIKRNCLQISPNNTLDLKSFNIISGHIPTLEHIFLLYIPTELLCVPTSNIFHISKIHKSIPEQFELNTLLYFFTNNHFFLHQHLLEKYPAIITVLSSSIKKFQANRAVQNSCHFNT